MSSFQEWRDLRPDGYLVRFGIDSTSIIEAPSLASDYYPEKLNSPELSNFAIYNPAGASELRDLSPAQVPEPPPTGAPDARPFVA